MNAHSRQFSFMLGLLSCVFLGASPAWALKVIPFVAQFAPKGPGASQTFRVENDTAGPMAVQLSMVHRIMTIDGGDKLTNADDDFAVFPPQLVLLPNEARTVRVQWLGDPAPKTERSYRLIVEQLPVNLNAQQRKGGAVRITMRYETAIYVTPSDAKGALSLEQAAPVPGTNNVTMLAVTLRNSGTAHIFLENPVLTLRSQKNGRSVTLQGAQQLKGMAGENLLAGVERRFVLPWPAELPVGPVEANLKLGGSS